MNFNNNLGDLVPLVAGMKSQGVAQLGVSYDLKFVKLFGQLYTKNDQISGSWHVNTAQGGVTVPLGYDYPLSKRTDVYTAYMNDRLPGMSSGNTFGAVIRAKF